MVHANGIPNEISTNCANSEQKKFKLSREFENGSKILVSTVDNLLHTCSLTKCLCEKAKVCGVLFSS